MKFIGVASFFLHLSASLAEKPQVCAQQPSKQELILLQTWHSNPMISAHEGRQFGEETAGYALAEYNAYESEYRRVHIGHCASGWMGGNVLRATVHECAVECRSREGCGFFAYAEGKTAGSNCALYTESSGCPDDYEHPDYIAYALAPTPSPTPDCDNMGGSDCSASLQSWAGAGNCVAAVTTLGHNCNTYCHGRWRSCVKGMDNVDKCVLNTDGHNRQTTAKDGCLQNWGEQICVCGSVEVPTPAPTLAPTTLLGARNTNACPENSYPIDKEGCEQAASGLDKPFRETNRLSNSPKGCFDDGSSFVYWNPDYTGGADVNARPICTTVAPTIASTTLLGAPNTNACPDNSVPVDKEGCYQASSSLGKPFDEVNRLSNYPKGCFEYGSSFVYWNPDPAGGSNANARPICTMESSLGLLDSASDRHK